MRFHARSCAIAIVLVNRLSTVLTTIVLPVWHVAYGMFRIAVALTTAGMPCLALSCPVFICFAHRRLSKACQQTSAEIGVLLEVAQKSARPFLRSLRPPPTTPHRRSPFSCPPAVDASSQRGPRKAPGKPHSSPTRFKLSAAAQFCQISDSIQHAKRCPSITHHFTSINASANTLRSKTTSFIHSFIYFCITITIKITITTFIRLITQIHTTCLKLALNIITNYNSYKLLNSHPFKLFIYLVVNTNKMTSDHLCQIITILPEVLELY